MYKKCFNFPQAPGAAAQIGATPGADCRVKGGKPRQPDQNSTQEKNVERVLQVGRGAAIFPGTTYPGRPEHFRYFPEKWKSHWAARESILNLEKVPPNPLQSVLTRFHDSTGSFFVDTKYRYWLDVNWFVGPVRSRDI